MIKNICNKISVLLFGTAIFFSCNGCDNFVDVAQPNSQLTSDAVFESKVTANAAIADVYIKMRENGFLNGKSNGLSMVLGAYADELTSYDAGAYSVSNFYNNALLSSNITVSGLWNASYNAIYAANVVYAKTENSTALTAANKDQLMGEALFLRALNHFYLANLFGDVPYVMGTDYVVNGQIGKTASALVYELVQSDLEQAVAMLPEAYVTPERVRANRGAAQALLARVYLYQGKWAEASDMASAVINQTDYVLDNDIDQVFFRGSTGTILQFAPNYEGHNTDEGSVFVLISGPPSLAAISEQFYNAFEGGDLRKNHWIGSVTDGIDTWYFPNKYKEQNDTGSSLEFSKILRIEEQYLIRAESRAIQGELIGAKEDLNVIRNRAGLPNTPAVTAQQIADAVVNERRFEMFTEHGHRFFDLKRNGMLNMVLGAKPGWNNTDALWPVPLGELLLNPLLNPQNSGY